jgi:hypothetical protein
MHDKQILALSKEITETNKPLDNAVWQMKRDGGQLRKVVKDLQLQPQTLQKANPLDASAISDSVVSTPSRPSQYPHCCGEDKSAIPESDFKFVPEDAGVKLEAGLSLDNDSDANNCRFFLEDKAVHFIDRSFNPQPSTKLKADSADKSGFPEEKSSIAQPPRKKKGGKKKHF